MTTTHADRIATMAAQVHPDIDRRAVRAAVDNLFPTEDAETRAAVYARVMGFDS